MSLHNDYALVVALDTSTDMLACAASWIDGQTGETKQVSGDHMCRRHANVELVNTVDSVLAQAGMDRADVGSYVVCARVRLRACVSASPPQRVWHAVPTCRCWACRHLTLAPGQHGEPAYAASLVFLPMPCAARCTRRSMCWGIRPERLFERERVVTLPPWRLMSGARPRTGIRFS